MRILGSIFFKKKKKKKKKKKGKRPPTSGPENPPEAIEKIESVPGEIETSPTAQDPLALPGLLTRGSRGEGRGEGPGRLAAVECSPGPSS